jgi:hypothetical protein
LSGESPSDILNSYIKEAEKMLAKDIADNMAIGTTF